MDRRQRDDDFERELQSHIDAEAQDLEAAGMRPEDAQLAARKAFGNRAIVKEDVRAAEGWTWLEQVGQDFRIALRGIRKARGFALVGTVAIALGVGAVTAVFSVFNAAALRPLAVEKPEQLVLLESQKRGKRFVFFHPEFEALAQGQRSFTALAAISDEPYMKATFEREAPVLVRGSKVSGSYFPMMGLEAAAGRLLRPEDDEPGGACVAVISHAFWLNRWQGDASALGRTLEVRERPCTIVGVAPERFEGHQAGFRTEVWLALRPLTDAKLLASKQMAFYSGVMGRLRPNTDRTRAQAELTGLYQQLHEANEPGHAPGEAPTRPQDFGVAVKEGAQGLDAVRQRFGQPLQLALAVTAILLLIAALNVANLSLAHGAARSSELATRAALGASRGRLARLLAMEGLVLAGLGGSAGVVAALVIAPALSTAVMENLNTVPDIRVLGVALAATLAAALLGGLAPAWRLSTRNLHGGMAGVGRTTGSRGGQRLTRILVGAQLALALLLVSAAGLLTHTMLRVMRVDPGFEPAHVVMLDVRDTEPAARFGETDGPEQKARRATQYRLLEQRLNEIPGVRAAAVSWLGLFGRSYVGLNTYDVERPEQKKFTLVDYVSPRYFEATGMTMRRGRSFTAADGEGAPRVAVVNEAFARERLGGAEALGRRLVMTYADDLRPWTIAGVVRDAKYQDLREAKTEPMLWVPIAQAPFKANSVTLRTEPGSEASVIQAARAALKQASPHLMVLKSKTLVSQVADATARERLLLKLAAAFGGLALLLAAVGLYGTFAYSVAQRTREFGVRMALGAPRQAVLRLILRESVSLVGVAVMVGVPASVAAGTLLRSFLFGIPPHDPWAMTGSVAVLTAVALAAAFIPARRATRIDPLAALRDE